MVQINEPVEFLKSDKNRGPDEYLPPDNTFHCEYSGQVTGNKVTQEIDNNISSIYKIAIDDRHLM